MLVRVFFRALIWSGLLTSTLAVNPLATSDQRDLDKLATTLSQSSDYNGLKAAARAQFILTLKTYGITIDEDVNIDIDLATEELVFSSIQKAINSDSAHPKVYWVDAGPRTENWFGLSVPGGRYSYDNPDCIYRTIPISSQYDYVIHGQRHQDGPTDTTFSLLSNVNSQNTIAVIADDDLVIGDNGTYTITISSSKSNYGNAPNFIQSNTGAVQLFVRNNLADWSTETADDITVEIVGSNAAAASSKTPQPIDSIISKAKEYLSESTFFYVFGALNVKTLINPVNVVKDPSQSSTLGTLTTQASSFGHFDLSSDEALVVTLNAGKSTYWTLPVYSLGMVTHEPWQNIISFNNKQSKGNDNGTYTFVISDADPGVYNWVNTTSRNKGLFMARWQGLPKDESDNGIEVFSQVARISELTNILPNETVYVNVEQRQQQVQERIQGYNRIHNQ